MAGYGSDGAGTNHLLVRKSSDQGATWHNSDDYTYPSGTNAAASSFGTDSLANLYTSGYGKDGSAIPHLIVRKSTNHGTSWATTDDYIYPGSADTEASGFGIDYQDNLFSTGFSNVSGMSHWITRKSSNHGSTWSLSDDFIYPTSTSTQADGLGIDASGNIFTVGYAIDGSSVKHWLVRKSSDRGGSWMTVDDFVYPGGTASKPFTVGIDASGNVYVGGKGNDAAGHNHWLLRKSMNGGSTWVTVDNYLVSPSTDASILGFAIDTLGNLFAGGLSNGANGGVLRKLSCH
jgi:hypothetical protein